VNADEATLLVLAIWGMIFYFTWLVIRWYRRHR
jgi:hypothetical protein